MKKNQRFLLSLSIFLSFLAIFLRLFYGGSNNYGKRGTTRSFVRYQVMLSGVRETCITVDEYVLSGAYFSGEDYLVFRNQYFIDRLAGLNVIDRDAVDNEWKYKPGFEFLSEIKEETLKKFPILSESEIDLAYIQHLSQAGKKAPALFDEKCVITGGEYNPWFYDDSRKNRPIKQEVLKHGYVSILDYDRWFQLKILSSLLQDLRELPEILANPNAARDYISLDRGSAESLLLTAPADLRYRHIQEKIFEKDR